MKLKSGRICFPCRHTRRTGHWFFMPAWQAGWGTRPTYECWTLQESARAASLSKVDCPLQLSRALCTHAS
jgi:hypothetical protein